MKSNNSNNPLVVVENVFTSFLGFISNLPYRNADIIRMFFGIGMQALSLEEIGVRFGLSEERIRQLREEGLEILRSNYSEELKELL